MEIRLAVTRPGGTLFNHVRQAQAAGKMRAENGSTGKGESAGCGEEERNRRQRKAKVGLLRSGWFVYAGNRLNL